MTTNSVVECILKSEDPLYLDVPLPDRVSVIVGRGPSTKIKAKRCSKQQVKLTADYKKATVEILQLGPNPSQVDHSDLRIKSSIVVSDGTFLNLLKGELPYVVTFNRGSTKHQKCNPVNGTDIVKLQQKVNTIPKTNEKEQVILHASSENCSKTKDVKLKREAEFRSDGIEIAEKQIKLEPDEKKNDNEEEQKIKSIEEKLHSMQHNFGSSTIAEPKQMAKPKQPPKQIPTIYCFNKWEQEENGNVLIYEHAGLQSRNKIAAFDLDHTIITTVSGHVFPIDTHDWKIMFTEIPGKLKSLNEEGYKIVFFTNQRNISKGRTDPTEFKKKIENVAKKLGVPVQIFISTSPGLYRKPAPGMWDILVNKYNDGLDVDLNSSFYVGDAAGRIANWKPKKKKDFSCGDRLFAINMKVQFHTPEEFFLSYEKAHYVMPNFDPRQITSRYLATVVESVSRKNCPVPLDESSLIFSSPEIVTFVGYPAAGKTHFAENYLIPQGYFHINRDTLGSWKKCVIECETALQKGCGVIIDNTNPDIESRKRYIEVGSRFKVPCRCFLFPCSLDQAKHNNLFRLITAKDKAHVGVNDMVLNSFKLKYQEPKLREGFEEIVKVNFKPNFRSSEEERLYRMFLIDK